VDRDAGHHRFVRSPIACRRSQADPNGDGTTDSIDLGLMLAGRGA